MPFRIALGDGFFGDVWFFFGGGGSKGPYFFEVVKIPFAAWSVFTCMLTFCTPFLFVSAV